MLISLSTGDFILPAIHMKEFILFPSITATHIDKELHLLYTNTLFNLSFQVVFPTSLMIQSWGLPPAVSYSKH